MKGQRSALCSTLPDVDSVWTPGDYTGTNAPLKM